MTKKEQEFIDLAIKRLKKGVDADSHNRIAGIEDLKFLNGDQWDPIEKKRRSLSGRPALTINVLPKYTDQVHGEMRQNRPKIKIRPVDSSGDIDIAKIRQGIISNAEYISNAEAVYDYGGQCALEGGLGAWRVLTRYIEENPFNQEFYLESITNPYMIVLDPDAKDACGADAEWGFILEKISRDDFEDDYPNADAAPEMFKVGPGLGQEHWYDDNTVTVAEYFIKDRVKKTYAQLSDGRVFEKKEAEKIVKEWEKKEEMKQQAIMKMAMVQMINPAVPLPQGPAGAPMGPAQPAGVNPQPAGPPPPVPPGQIPSPGGMPPPMMGGPGAPAEEPLKIAKTRESDVTMIKHYILTCMEILSEGGTEGEDFPGRYIPIVPVYGKDRNVEGKRYVRSLIRDAKDAQKLINYWETVLAETIALAPKAPWTGTAKMFEGYEQDYAKANTENFPFLKYNIDDSVPTSKPTREQHGNPPMALFSEAQRAHENIKATIGMFNADIGDRGPERTGAAIIQRQKPGDVGTYAFIDNWARSIKHTGKIMDSMIPDIFDTERVVRVRHEDDSESFVPINTSADDAFKMIKADPQRFPDIDLKKLRKSILQNGRSAKFNDVTAGHYDAEVHVGPSYSTQRAEAAENLIKLMQTNPKLMQLAGDLVVKNLDFKDADELSERLRMVLPPGMIKLKEGEEPPKPPPPTPAVQVQMAKLEIEKMKLEVQKIKVLKELQGEKGEFKKMILDVLKEVHAPQHPADQIPGMGGGQIQ